MGKRVTPETTKYVPGKRGRPPKFAKEGKALPPPAAPPPADPPPPVGESVEVEVDAGLGATVKNPLLDPPPPAPGAPGEAIPVQLSPVGGDPWDNEKVIESLQGLVGPGARLALGWLCQRAGRVPPTGGTFDALKFDRKATRAALVAFPQAAELDSKKAAIAEFVSACGMIVLAQPRIPTEEAPASPNAPPPASGA